MRNYAVIQNGIVDNIIYADDCFHSEDMEIVLLDDLLPVGIGDRYDGINFYHQDGTIIKTLYQELKQQYNNLLEEYIELSLSINQEG